MIRCRPEWRQRILRSKLGVRRARGNDLFAFRFARRCGLLTLSSHVDCADVSPSLLEPNQLAELVLMLLQAEPVKADRCNNHEARVPSLYVQWLEPTFGLGRKPQWLARKDVRQDFFIAHNDLPVDQRMVIPVVGSIPLTYVEFSLTVAASKIVMSAIIPTCMRPRCCKAVVPVSPRCFAAF